MSPIESFAAYGAPAILIILGYALVWWTRLAPGLATKLGRMWESFASVRHAPHK